MSTKQKCNAYVRCEEKGRYTNFYCVITNKDGREISFQFDPFCTDKKVKRKLCYLIKCAVEE